MAGSSAVAATPTEPRDRSRRLVGLALYLVFVVVGLVLDVLGTFLDVATSKTPHLAQQALVAGAVPAFAMLLVYLPLPAVLDRYDPEPWWSLAMAFFWGAFAATGCAGTINTAVQLVASRSIPKTEALLYTTCIVAPVTEELMKGLGVLGFSYFLRREFDGVVDGIVYATFAALGFAAVENVHYYADAAMRGHDVFHQTFVLRGIIAPWGHPLYTSMTGIGLGVARAPARRWLRVVAPVAGLVAAMALHATWNFIPNMVPAVFAVSLAFWFVFVGVFVVIVVVLVSRKGRIIRENLRDEVLFGTLTEREVRAVTSPVARLRTYVVRGGGLERRFIRAAQRLAVAKWHTGRAARGHRRTLSIELIGPLRHELQTLRAERARRGT
jgi:RsiW-degrading membrane proteinase PrsW (M82 family)